MTATTGYPETRVEGPGATCVWYKFWKIFEGLASGVGLVWDFEKWTTASCSAARLRGSTVGKKFGGNGSGQWRWRREGKYGR